MNIPILNRANDFKMTTGDGWVQIVPNGEYPNTIDGQSIMQIVDDESKTEILNRFQQESENPNFPGLRIDFDHNSYDPKQSSEAAGWVHAIENRDDGLWGKVKWSTLGLEAIRGGVFKLLSPALNVKPIAPGRVRPFRLDSVGLTNNPAMKGMMPVSNRETIIEESTISTQQQQKVKKMDEKILSKLGLAADAASDAVIQAVEALQTKVITSETNLTTVTGDLAVAKNRVQTLEVEAEALLATNRELNDAQIENDLNKYGNRFSAAARADWKGLLVTNRKTAIALLEGLPMPTAPAAGKTTEQAVLNREQGKQPTPRTFKTAIDEECAKNSCTKGKAMDIVKSREPELHKAWLDAGGGLL